MRGRWFERRFLPVSVVIAVLVVAAAAAALPGGPAPRGATQGPPFRVSRALADEHTPAVAYNSAAGEYLVVWQDYRQEAERGIDIYAQRVAGDGALLGVNFRISGLTATADESLPAVAYNSASGEYLVVWTDQRSDSVDGSAIYGQRVSAGGSLIGGNFLVNSTLAVDASNPALAYNPYVNEYLVVWWDWRNTNGYDVARELFARRVGAGGSPVGSEISVGYGIAEYGLPKVAYHPTTHHYLVVWGQGNGWYDDPDDPFPTECPDIRGRHLAEDGVPIGLDFWVSPGGDHLCAAGPDVIAVPARGFSYLVVWEDSRDQATRGLDIYGRRITSGGGPLGSAFRISGTWALGDETHPRLAGKSAADLYLVTWRDTRNDTTRGNDIYGKRLTGLVLPSGADFRISGKTLTTDEGRPETAYNSADDEYLVVFHTNRFMATRGWEVYGQRVVGSP